MKSLLLLVTFFSLSTVNAESNSQRIKNLEDRLDALVHAISKQSCKLNFKTYDTRLNICATGTFAYAAFGTGFANVQSSMDNDSSDADSGDEQLMSGNIQLKCGYYQLNCN